MIRFTFVILLSSFLFGCGILGKNPGGDAGDSRGSPKILDPDGGGGGGISLSDLVKKKRAKPEVYQVKTTKPLEVPPELISSTNDTVLANINSDVNDAIKVLPQVVGARIVRNDSDRWLEIDTSAEEAWTAVTNYWSLGNVDLVDFNPGAGIMETQWIEQTKETSSKKSTFTRVATNLLSSFTKKNTSLNKYRLRFERISEEQTALHVSHRSIGRTEINKSKIASEFEWVELPSDSEREAELLQNLILLFENPSS